MGLSWGLPGDKVISLLQVYKTHVDWMGISNNHEGVKSWSTVLKHGCNSHCVQQLVGASFSTSWHKTFWLPTICLLLRLLDQPTSFFSLTASCFSDITTGSTIKIGPTVFWYKYTYESTISWTWCLLWPVHNWLWSPMTKYYSGLSHQVSLSFLTWEL